MLQISLRPLNCSMFSEQGAKETLHSKIHTSKGQEPCKILCCDCVSIAAHLLKHCIPPIKVEPSHEYKPKRKAG